MYFPQLIRREKDDYLNSQNRFYADYRSNYEKVAADCKHRCVYCDITVEEFGGDEMQLDHFRPQEHFEHLSIDPFNLYLSCPKCNVLKTSDWPCAKADGAPSFIGGVGYLDRFLHKTDDFLRVDNDGKIVQIAGPVNYMIRKMHLNRASRVNVRRRRSVAIRKTKILEGIMRLTERLTQDRVRGEVTDEQANERQVHIMSLLAMYAQL